VAGAQVVGIEDEVMLVTAAAMIIRLQVAGISQLSRDTQGVLVQRLEGDDEVVAVARVPVKVEDSVNGPGEEENPREA